MRVGIPRETTEGERRVALVPETVGKLAAGGFDASALIDSEFELADAGAALGRLRAPGRVAPKVVLRIDG